MKMGKFSRQCKGISALLFFLIVAGNTAYATDKNEGNTLQVLDKNPDLIAKVTRANGNVVEFYEPLPGRIIVSESGPVYNAPLSQEIDIDEMQAVELYQYLAPGTAVPSLLLHAQEREYLTPVKPNSTTPSQEKTATTDNPGNVRGSFPKADTGGNDAKCTQSWFSENIYACRREAVWKLELYRRTGDMFFLADDTVDVDVGTCTYRGSIVMRLELWRPNTSSWYVHSNWQVDEGLWRSVWSTNYNDPTDIRTTVYSASGDGYHLCSADGPRDYPPFPTP